MTAIVTVEHLTKRYDAVTAVDDIGFSVGANEFFSLLGPSGCGKTTTLRSVAGLESAQGGRISMAGDVVFDAAAGIDRPPNQRPIGMVFQSYAVWPHMSVFENIGYPLRVRGMPREDIRDRVVRVLDMLGMGTLGDRMPSQLSGGQQQRVALGRALALDPTVLLLDEPLSNLDARLRELMRAELKHVQRETGLPILYVTHDQDEALAMSDRIAVIDGGIVHQIDTPMAIYSRPASRFVLDFIGTVSYLPCRVVSRDDHIADVLWGPGETIRGRASATDTTPASGPAVLAVRPEDVRVRQGATDVESAEGTVVLQAYRGDAWEYRIRVGNDIVRVRTAKQQSLDEGAPVAVSIDAAVVLSEGATGSSEFVWGQ